MDIAKDICQKQSPNLYLCGFMGTGKTTLGKRLATRLKFRFIDSDSEIENRCNLPVKEIFAKFGEAKFRKMEREFLESGHPSNGCVVSLGGGLVCRDDMPELLKSKGVSVVLFSSPEEIFERTCHGDDRPLLNCPDPVAKIRTLLAERTPYYLRSGISIATDKNLKFTENHILRIYNARSRAFLRAQTHDSKKSAAR